MVFKAKSKEIFVRAISGIFDITKKDLKVLLLILEGETDRKVMSDKLGIKYESIANNFKRLRDKKALDENNVPHKLFTSNFLVIEKTYED